VEADAGQAGALGSRDEHATAQTALIGAAPARPASANASSSASRARSARSNAARPGVSGISRAVPGPRRDDRALDDRATHPAVRRVAVENEIAPAQTDRLRDAQPGRGDQLEQRTPPGRDLVEQPNELRPSEESAARASTMRDRHGGAAG